MTQRRRNWSDIQPELLELILQRLPLMDYLKCRQVSSFWRTIVDEALTANHRCPPAPHFPFLLLLAHNRNTTNLLSLTQDRLYTLPTATWKHYYRVSWVRPVDGWLMFQNADYKPKFNQSYTSIWFFNPVSRIKFKLPKLPLFSGSEFNGVTYQSMRMALSSTPDSPEFLVAICALIKVEDQLKQQLAFCKVIDKSWNFIDTNESRTMIFHDIAFRGFQLYACTREVIDFVVVFNISDPNAITAERVAMLDPKPILIQGNFEVKDGLHYFTDRKKILLVKDTACGELLIVVFVCDKIVDPDTEIYLLRTKAFHVFRLDISGSRWLEIDNLGDRILLFDSSGVQVISAKDFKCPGKLTGGNCVYFSVRSYLSVDSFPKLDVGVFSLTDKSIRRFPLNSSLQVCARSLWFTPSPW